VVEDRAAKNAHTRCWHAAPISSVLAGVAVGTGAPAMSISERPCRCILPG